MSDPQRETRMAALALRRTAYEAATELVDPIADAHPLEAYEVRGSGPPLASQSRSTMTAAEQRLSLTVDLADWLLGDRR